MFAFRHFLVASHVLAFQNVAVPHPFSQLCSNKELTLVLILSCSSAYVMLGHAGASLTLEGLPLPGWLIPRDSQWLACQGVFPMQTNQCRARIPNHLFSRRSLSGPLSSCLIHRRARHQRTRDHPFAQGPLKLSTLTNPKPLTL